MRGYVVRLGLKVRTSDGGWANPRYQNCPQSLLVTIPKQVLPNCKRMEVSMRNILTFIGEFVTLLLIFASGWAAFVVAHALGY